MAYVNQNFWAENIDRAYVYTGHANILRATSLLLDATGESVEVIGTLRITDQAANVAFDTNSKIKWRTGTGNVVAGATQLTISIQDVSGAAGPPGQGDGTDDVSKMITIDTLADATTYETQMDTGSKTLSHGQRICGKFALGTRNGADSLRIQSVVNQGGGVNTGLNYNANLNGALAANTPSPLILDFEGDGSVLGYIDHAYPMIETQGNIQTLTVGLEAGMIIRPTMKCKVDGFWIAARMTDAVNADLVMYTSPLGTPSGTTLMTVDGDSISAVNVHMPLMTFFDPIELSANTDYAFVVKSAGSSAFVFPYGFHNIKDVAHFRGFGINDRRCHRDSSGNPAFTEVANQQHLWGVHVCATDIPAGGGQRVYGA